MKPRQRNRNVSMNIRKSNANQNGSYQAESRQRGQAHQMLEKYNNLAREALVSGDRVLAEGYFQYADHFQRILNDIKANVVPMREPSTTAPVGDNSKDHRPKKDSKMTPSKSDCIIVKTDNSMPEDLHV